MKKFTVVKSDRRLSDMYLRHLTVTGSSGILEIIGGTAVHVWHTNKITTTVRPPRPYLCEHEFLYVCAILWFTRYRRRNIRNLNATEHRLLSRSMQISTSALVVMQITWQVSCQALVYFVQNDVTLYACTQVLPVTILVLLLTE